MGKILDELFYYSKSNNPEISCFSIETIGKLALKGGKFLPKCTKILLNLFKNESLSEVDDIVLALTRIITNVIKGFSSIYKRNYKEFERKYPYSNILS